MKYLFIVQGEGRGHLTQALTLEEIFIYELGGADDEIKDIVL